MSPCRLLLLVAPCALLSVSCGSSSDDSDDDPSAAFERAALLDAAWCELMQVNGAGLSDTTVIDAIELTMVDTKAALTGSHTEVVAGTSPSIVIYGYGEVAGLGGVDRTQTLYCKTRSKDYLEVALELTLAGEQGTCRARNEAALAWALEQLSDEARARYLNDGQLLSFADDGFAINGAGWTAMPQAVARDGAGFVYTSAALLVPWADDSNLPDYAEGVAYCKLLSPSAALHWVLAAAFESDPESSLVTPSGGVLDCPIAEPTPAGSCVFYFPVSQQHYCEDYTGPDWTAGSARDRCDGRELANGPAVFSASPCADRSDETSQLDGDGVFRGQCVIDCGGATEYRWNVYSDAPGGGTPADSCPNDWFEA